MIGKEFNQLVNKNVLSEISNALISLNTDLLYLEDKEACDIFNEYSEMLRKTVNCYIDNQKTVFQKLRTDS